MSSLRPPAAVFIRPTLTFSVPVSTPKPTLLPLEGTAVTELLKTAAGDLKLAAAAMLLPLIARDRDGQVVVALVGVPSYRIIATVSQLPGEANRD